MIDTARYVMAVVLIMTWPPALLYWFIVHPFVGVWRRVGWRQTFGLLGLFFVLSAATLWWYRDAILIRDLGSRWPNLVIALPLLMLASWLQRERKKQLDWKTLAGLPELSPEAHAGPLLTEGIYGVIRHPRYVEAALGALAWAMLVNYASVYALTALFLVLLLPIVLFEERELRARFGARYVAYAQRVPRFVPRWSTPRSPSQ